MKRYRDLTPWERQRENQKSAAFGVIVLIALVIAVLFIARQAPPAPPPPVAPEAELWSRQRVESFCRYVSANADAIPSVTIPPQVPRSYDACVLYVMLSQLAAVDSDKK